MNENLADTQTMYNSATRDMHVDVDVTDITARGNQARNTGY